MKKIMNFTLAAMIGVGTIGFMTPSTSYAAKCASIDGPKQTHYLGSDCYESTLYFGGGSEDNIYYFYAEEGAKVNFWLERGVKTDFEFTVINPDGDEKNSKANGKYAQEVRGFKTETSGRYEVIIHSDNGYVGRDFKLKVRQTN